MPDCRVTQKLFNRLPRPSPGRPRPAVRRRAQTRPPCPTLPPAAVPVGVGKAAPVSLWAAVAAGGSVVMAVGDGGADVGVGSGIETTGGKESHMAGSGQLLVILSVPVPDGSCPRLSAATAADLSPCHRDQQPGRTCRAPDRPPERDCGGRAPADRPAKEW
jgi:hypothetical protein